MPALQARRGRSSLLIWRFGASRSSALSGSPHRRFLGLALRIVIEELDPTSISWDGKTAWRRCDSAIAGRTSWPQSPQGACAAMHLCANEAPLSDSQKQQLAQAIRETPDCPKP
jgi:hypothetical protein